MKYVILLSLIVILSSSGLVYAHTIDSVGDYRLEIGWMNEPVVSGESNGIELFVSPLDQSIPPDKQEFKNGVEGLYRSLKIQLVYEGQKVTLPLLSDHNIPGRYYAFVDPTRAGYYQANIIGEIDGTLVSLSMHPPPVENKTYLAFPSSPDEKILLEHESIRGEMDEIKQTLDEIKKSSQAASMSYIAIGLGIAGIIIGAIAFSRRK